MLQKHFGPNLTKNHSPKQELNLKEDKEDMALKIVLGTSNPNKVKEINEITSGLDVEFILPDSDFNPSETGSTFTENALCKALGALDCDKNNNKYFMADDSGLCVDYLDGAPGIKSARYAETPKKRIEKLLNALKDAKKEERNAHFTCALVLINNKGEVLHETLGICNGSIAHEEKGQNGFGYDPIFIVEDRGVTMAELSEEEKNKISHRGRAFSDMIEYLKTIS